MAKMYRIFSLLPLLIWTRTANAKCFREYDGSLKCVSIEEEEVQMLLNHYFCIYHPKAGGKHLLKIEDSFIPRFEMLRHQCDRFTCIDNLIVRNSRVESIHLFGDIFSGEFLSLDLSFNEIKKLNFLLSIRSLIKLEMGHNQINFLNGTFLANNKYLRYLDMSHNKIKNFTPLENKELNDLNLSHNLIEELGNLFIYSKALENVDLSHNKLKKISHTDFNGLEYIIYLNLNHNDIHVVQHTVHYGNLDPFYDEWCNSLWSINIENNNLENLYFLVNPKRREIKKDSLIFRRNKIKELYPHNFRGFILNELVLSYNEIESIPPRSFDGLVLKELYLDHNRISNLDGPIFANLPGLQLVNLSFNPLTTVGQVFEASVLNVLDISHCLLTKVPIGNFRHLSLDFNFIHQIEPGSFSSFVDQLESLSIVQNSLPVNSLVSLSQRIKWKCLNLTVEGEIEKKQFSSLFLLEELHIVDSNITELQKYSFKGLVYLKKISFENTTVFRIIPGAFLGLKNVLDFNARSIFSNVSTIKAETFVGLEYLQILDLSRTGISKIQDGAFIGLDNLNSLNLSHNKIEYLSRNSLVGLKNLQVLDLSNNFLRYGNIGTLRDLVDLTHLHLEHNSLIELQPGYFSNLKSLEFLNISHNKIRRMEVGLFYTLKKLRVLDINANLVSSDPSLFTFAYRGHLRKIGIGENRWDCEKLTYSLITFEKYFVDYTALSLLNFDDQNVNGIRCY